MPTTSLSFLVHAIPAPVLDEVRATGRDVSAHPVVRIPADGGEPLRCCLRDAGPGEELLLFGYEPPLPPSPYREIGAVFAHARRCDGPEGTGYPAAWRGRDQVLRAYDRRGWIVGSSVHDGRDPEAAITDLFADPSVTLVHSRNVGHGCFMFAVTRSEPAAR
ncbi:DUF1203 domain-containing protein [Plantactinospora sp. GCM10030261]|uniref:DUF1203 domain-containing protein n=1 Tax=Plantactinospora sp. GCM10030261 TaxID=3273420 RepID=UPI003611204D